MFTFGVPSLLGPGVNRALLPHPFGHGFRLQGEPAQSLERRRLPPVGRAAGIVRPALFPQRAKHYDGAGGGVQITFVNSDAVKCLYDSRLRGGA